MPLDEKDIATITEIIAKTMAEQQEAIKKTVSEQANGAVTKALKPIREKLDMTATKEDAEKLLAEKLAAAEEERKAKAAGGGAVDPKDAELQALKSRLDAAERKAQKEAQERETEKAQARRVEERSALQQTLVKAGLIPELVAPAIAVLTERGAVARDKDGAIVFTRKGEYGDEQLSLDDGIASFLKTPEGMAMLPPRDAGGSGDTKGVKRSAGGGGKLEMTPQLAGEVLRGAFGGP